VSWPPASKLGGLVVVDTVKGQPTDARQALVRIAEGGGKLQVIAGNQTTASWSVLEEAGTSFPALSGVKLVWPRSYRWPNFLKADNLLNIANQIAVIAIVAIGMTLVIIAAGIDLSVGSLIALSAVVCTLLIRGLAGAEHAGAAGMVLCSLAAIGVCGVVGLFSGAMVTWFGIPSFIATLAMMLVASGLAFIAAKGQSVYQVPDAFIWLGRGSTLGLPNAVLLMLLLYAAAHFVMTAHGAGSLPLCGGRQCRGGAALRRARAQGAALRLHRLRRVGRPGRRGHGLATQKRLPHLRQMYELYVIAAVVVGGTLPLGRRRQGPGHLHRCFHHRRHPKRHEPHRRGKLHSKGRAGPGHSRGGAPGHPQAARLAMAFPQSRFLSAKSAAASSPQTQLLTMIGPKLFSSHSPGPPAGHFPHPDAGRRAVQCLLARPHHGQNPGGVGVCLQFDAAGRERAHDANCRGVF